MSYAILDKYIFVLKQNSLKINCSVRNNLKNNVEEKVVIHRETNDNTLY